LQSAWTLIYHLDSARVNRD